MNRRGASLGQLRAIFVQDLQVEGACKGSRQTASSAHTKQYVAGRWGWHGIGKDLTLWIDALGVTLWLTGVPVWVGVAVRVRLAPPMAGD